MAAREARAAGIAWTFGPMWILHEMQMGTAWWKAQARIHSSARQWLRAQVRGFQGPQIRGTGTCYGLRETLCRLWRRRWGPRLRLALLPEELMWNVYLPPFKAALDAGVGHIHERLHGPE